jgi:hypothetical protein
MLQKNNLEEYFGIDVQMKIIDLDFLYSIYMVRFTKTIMNILLYNLKFLLNLITNKILTFLG